MATTTTNISLTKPEIGDTTLIREDFNDNMDIIDGRFSSTYMAVQAKNSVTITGGSITGITDLAIVDGGTGASTAANARTALGLAIGTNVQAYDDGLTAIAALAMTDSSMLVGNGTTWVLETGATLRTSLGLTIGTNVQAYDAALTSISGLVYVSASFIKFSANDTYVVRTIAETKTDLSLNLVENTALSTWAGTTNITTLGTIATGTWNATAIANAKIATALSGKTYNALTLTAAATGFTIAGGSTSKTLTMNDNFNVSTQLSAISANTDKVTESTSVSAPLVLSTYAISIPVATSEANGYLSSANWTTFNSKQAGDTALTNISALVYVSPSFIKLTADDTYAVRTLAQTLTDIGGAALQGVSAIGAVTFADDTHILSVATITYWFDGATYTTASPTTCDIDSYKTLTDNTLYYFYFDDASGTLKCTDTAWNFYTQVSRYCVLEWK